jgi:hypothetical protein
MVISSRGMQKGKPQKIYTASTGEVGSARRRIRIKKA